MHWKCKEQCQSSSWRFVRRMRGTALINSSLRCLSWFVAWRLAWFVDATLKTARCTDGCFVWCRVRYCFDKWEEVFFCCGFGIQILLYFSLKLSFYLLKIFRQNYCWIIFYSPYLLKNCNMVEFISINVWVNMRNSKTVFNFYTFTKVIFCNILVSLCFCREKWMAKIRYASKYYYTLESDNNSDIDSFNQKICYNHNYYWNF